MNISFLVILLAFVVNFPSKSANLESVNCSNSNNTTNTTCVSDRKTNASAHFSSSRQIFGYGLEDVKNLFEFAYRYAYDGVSYLSEKVVGFVSYLRGSKKNKFSYKGYQVLRIEAVDEKQVEHLQDLTEEIDGTEFWTPPVENYHTDLLVAPNSIDEVKEYLKEKGVDYQILIRDLQKVISFENPKMNKDQRNMLIGKRGHPMTWVRYHRYSDMIRYMEFLAFSYPHMVELLTIGYSTEGLPLKVVKIFSDSNENGYEEEKKPAFWIDGGMHGREWITSSVVLYIVKQFVENYLKHKETVDSAIWYFMPVANPDGYEYSHSTDRLWRKTRSTNDYSEFSFIKKLLFGSCEGVDLSSNFDFHWGENGVTDDPCRERYAGPHPFSEPETKAISDFIMERKDKLKMYVTLHAYSQMWLVPWSYTKKKTLDYSEMEKMAKKATEAIALVTGSHYDVGPSASLYEPISGTSEDWAKGVAGIKYSYAVKLRDRGSFGFLLPAAQIVPTAKEIFIAMKVMAKMITCLK